MKLAMNSGTTSAAALMVALLAACPIRLKNFAALETQECFRKIGETWWIFLKDTKSRRPDHRPVPDFLAGAIERYLEVYRPILLSNSVDQETNGTSHRSRRRKSKKVSPARITSALWISRFGGPMSYGQVQRVITETSYRLINVCLSPHLFRVAGATTAALYSPSPHLGSALYSASQERPLARAFNPSLCAMIKPAEAVKEIEIKAVAVGKIRLSHRCHMAGSTAASEPPPGPASCFPALAIRFRPFLHWQGAGRTRVWSGVLRVHAASGSKRILRRGLDQGNEPASAMTCVIRRG
jgi:hypothetical protein